MTAATTVGRAGTQRLDRWEWPAVLVLGAVSVVVVAFMATSLWHLSDAWDFLTGRSFVEPATWFEPHYSAHRIALPRLLIALDLSFFDGQNHQGVVLQIGFQLNWMHRILPRVEGDFEVKIPS